MSNRIDNLLAQMTAETERQPITTYTATMLAGLQELRQAGLLAVPEDWKLLPTDATLEMVEALKARIGVTSRGGILNAGNALNAAIAAAPSAPEPAAQELVAQCPFCGESSGHCDQGFPHPGKTAKTPPAAEQPDTVKVPRQLLEDAAHWLDAHASSGSAEAYIARELRALLGKEGE